MWIWVEWVSEEGMWLDHTEKSLQRLGLGRSVELLRSVPMACSLDNFLGWGLEQRVQ